MSYRKSKKTMEFGDFQTPIELTYKSLNYLKKIGAFPSTIIEPTCGIGSFIISAIDIFPNAKILGIDINSSYINYLRHKLENMKNGQNVELEVADFFTINRFVENFFQLIKGRRPTIIAAG